MPDYLSTDPDAGLETDKKYLSTDPNAGAVPEQKGIVGTALAAAGNVVGGFIKSQLHDFKQPTLKEVIGEIFPTSFGQTFAGQQLKGIEQTVSQVQEAEKTPAFSRERFEAGFNVAGQLGLLALGARAPKLADVAGIKVEPETVAPAAETAAKEVIGNTTQERQVAEGRQPEHTGDVTRGLPTETGGGGGVEPAAPVEGQAVEPVGKVREFSTAWDERGALEAKAMMSPDEFARYQYGGIPPDEYLSSIESNHRQVVADALANGLKANPEAIQKYGLTQEAKSVSEGGQAATASTLPEQISKPEEGVSAVEKEGKIQDEGQRRQGVLKPTTIDQSFAKTELGKDPRLVDLGDFQDAVAGKVKSAIDSGSTVSLRTNTNEDVNITSIKGNRLIDEDGISWGSGHLITNPDAKTKITIIPKSAEPTAAAAPTTPAAAAPTEPIPPESTEELGVALKTPPRSAGIANRVLAERAARGEIPPVPGGQGFLAKDLVAMAREEYEKNPQEAVNAAQRFQQGSREPKDMGLVRMHEEALTKAQATAEQALDADPKNPTLIADFNTAKDNLSKWHNETVQPMKTQWSNEGRTMQGVTNIDTGTFTGLQKLAWDTGKRDFTPQEAPIFKEMANRVAKSTNGEREAIQKTEAEVQRVLKPSRYMDLNTLRDSLHDTLKGISC